LINALARNTELPGQIAHVLASLHPAQRRLNSRLNRLGSLVLK
jgi:hypothetical protein